MERLKLPEAVRRRLLQLRSEMLTNLHRDASDTSFCERCLLPFPEGVFEEYEFCPWCAWGMTAADPREDESRRIIEAEWEDHDDIQCGECGDEYDQPRGYPFRFCPHCGARFAAEDEFVIVLPFRV